MKQSLTFHIILCVLKLKGLKKDFSLVPINFKKIRKKDVLYPKGKFFERHTLRNFNVLNSSITEIGLNKNFDSLLIFVHGGAFISGPAKHHWEAVKSIAKRTNHTIWMCDYPKAPENQIKKISENIDAIYSSALKNYPNHHISIIGDSVGGTLATALIQRLIINEIALPTKVILISPVLDASMSNPEIDNLEKLDPVLSKSGVLSAKKMCAGNISLKDQLISPLYGNFGGFPRTILFLSQHDIMYPDGKLAERKLKKANVEIEVIEGKNMPHIWPLLPLMKESKMSMNSIIRILNNS